MHVGLSFDNYSHYLAYNELLCLYFNSACKQVFILNINLFLCLDDNNRVVLSNIPDVEHSDYINASYIDVSEHF